jgi:hypothetical protein
VTGRPTEDDQAQDVLFEQNEVFEDPSSGRRERERERVRVSVSGH